MRKFVWLVSVSTLFLSIAAGQAFAARLTGQVTQTSNNKLVACFSAPVEPNTMMIVLSGDGEAVAGMAVSEKCEGKDPYVVTGQISFVSDSSNFAAGKKVYVNSLNTAADTCYVPPAPTAICPPRATAHSPRNPDPALRFYYYAAGQTVGYGSLGLGYEHFLRISKGLSLQLDGAVAGVGNVNTDNPNQVSNGQLMESLDGRFKFDLAPGFGTYAGYRWNEGRGDQTHWDQLAGRLEGTDFPVESGHDPGTVVLQGIEYGLSFSPANKFNLCLGYIPKYRIDFGGIGVISQPAYTAELRFGTGNGGLRLRGISTNDYWLADLGVTIK